MKAIVSSNLNLCESARDSCFQTAQRCQVVLDAGEPPEWIMLVPAGDHIIALDGRKFSNTDPQGVVDQFNADPRDLIVDFEHASEIKAPKGEKAPAAGWIDVLEVRDGAIYGRTTWTPAGAEALRTREYRYVSPAFLSESKTKKILELVSSALVNRPALDMPSLAQASTNSGAEHQTTKENSMDPRLLALLGLHAEATADDVCAALKKQQVELETFRIDVEKVTKDRDEYRDLCNEADKELVAARAGQNDPSVDKFVPRADHDAVVARAETAETKLQEQDATAKQKEIDAAIDSALKAGKITPVSVKYHKEQCAQEGGLERFAEYVAGAPAVGAPNKTPTDKPSDTPKELTADQRKIGELCGHTGDVLKAYEKSQASA